VLSTERAAMTAMIAIIQIEVRRERTGVGAELVIGEVPPRSEA
jgi:hypothetical protein